MTITVYRALDPLMLIVFNPHSNVPPKVLVPF